MKQSPIKFFRDFKITARPQQEEVLEQVYSNWNKFDYFAFSLPTGVGKTYIATSIADAVGSAYILTSTLQLQDQYQKSWGEIVNLKGRSNYTCNLNPNFTVEAAPCSASKELFQNCMEHRRCSYYNQRDAAIASKAMITNPVYMLYSTHCGFAADDAELEPRDVLIIDEAHNLENHLVQFAESDIDPEKYQKDFGINADKFQFTGNPEKDYMIVIEIKRALEVEAEKLKAQIEDQFPQRNLFDGDFQSWARGISMKAAEGVRKLQVKANILDKAIQPLNIFFNTHTTPEELTCRWIISKYNDRNVLKLSPLYGDFLFHYYFGKLANKFVFLSATLGTKKAFCREIGVPTDKCFFIETDSPFDAKKSPIIVMPVIKLSKEVYDENVKKVGQFVSDILKLHVGQRGVIHSVTYDLQTKIWNQVSKGDKSRLLCRDMDILIGKEVYPKKYNNIELLRIHDSKKDSVLLSPSMMEGIDLKDDLSDFQIIIKLPWAYLGDIRIKRKSELDDEWYANKMWLNIMQASGRSTRHENDSSITYILDSNFKYFYNNWKNKLPGWFKDRLIFD